MIYVNKLKTINLFYLIEYHKLKLEPPARKLMQITLYLATVFPSHPMLYIKPPPAQTHPVQICTQGDDGDWKAGVYPASAHGDHCLSEGDSGRKNRFGKRSL